LTRHEGPPQSGVDSPSSRVLFCLLFGAGTSVYFVLPIWAGLFEERFGFSAAQIGWLLSADMSANTVATLLARLWLHRVHSRHAILSALGVYVLGNLACLGVSEFALLLLLRYVVGFGLGTLVAISYVGIGATERPDRNFGFALSVQVAIGGALLFATPYLVEMGGIGSYFVVFCIVMSSVLFLLKKVPASFEKESVAARATMLGMNGPMLLALLGVAVFFTGMNAYWSFAERVADQAGLAADFVASALAVSVLVSVLGSLLAAWMSNRYGRIGPILAGSLIAIGSVALLLLGPSGALFFIAINGFNFMYNFIIPFQSGWVADLDTSGRNITVLPAIQGGGVSLGPIVAGTLITGANYVPVIYVSMFFLFLSALMYSALRVLVSDRTGEIAVRMSQSVSS
jgi:predicted MFS family arabinose efflux permease